MQLNFQHHVLSLEAKRPRGLRSEKETPTPDNLGDAVTISSKTSRNLLVWETQIIKIPLGT